MGLWDVLIVIAVFAGFGYMILARMYRQNPQRTEKFVNWVTKTKEKINEKKEFGDKQKQIYIERREIL